MAISSVLRRTTCRRSTFVTATASKTDAPVYTFDGEVYVIPNDLPGRLQQRRRVDAADFMAEVQEIFDDADSKGVDTGYWLLTPRFTYNGSPIGCDANSSARSRWRTSSAR